MKSEEVLLRELLRDEEEAVAHYVNAADKIKNEAIKKILLDIADEEKVHKGELLRCLKELGITDKFEIRQGKHEATNKMLTDRLREIQGMLDDIAIKHNMLPDQVAIIPAPPVEVEVEEIIAGDEEPKKEG